MEWPAEKLLRLIELFKSKRCLWDPQDTNHKKTYVKDRAWNSMGDELGVNTIETKKKMESLLASYRRERKKCELASASSGPDKVYISKWFAFKAMSFMNNRSSIRRPQNDPNDFVEETIEEEDNSQSQDSYEQHESKSTTEETLQNGVAFQVLPSLSDQPKDKTSCGHSDVSLPARQKRDASDIYGEYIAVKHRKYSDHVKHVLEHRIAQILFDADMSLYNPGTTTTFTISSRAPIIETQTVESSDLIYET